MEGVELYWTRIGNIMALVCLSVKLLLVEFNME